MITVSGEGLSIADIAAVARGAEVALSGDNAVLKRVHDSRKRIVDAVAAGQAIYGATTLYGGMADKVVPPEKLRDLQTISAQKRLSTPAAAELADSIRAAKFAVMLGRWNPDWGDRTKFERWAREHGDKDPPPDLVPGATVVFRASLQ